MTDLENYNNIVFEKIKHIDENGVEFWYARDLQSVLEYKQWKNFIKVKTYQRRYGTWSRVSEVY